MGKSFAYLATTLRPSALRNLKPLYIIYKKTQLVPRKKHTVLPLERYSVMLYRLLIEGIIQKPMRTKGGILALNMLFIGILIEGLY